MYEKKNTFDLFFLAQITLRDCYLIRNNVMCCCLLFDCADIQDFNGAERQQLSRIPCHALFKLKIEF